MTCEKCRNQDATVYLTIVSGSASTATHNFCESCYPAVESERARNYNTDPVTPLPTNVENITVVEYLEAAEKADHNGADKPAFRHIQEQLRRHPEAQQRLAREMLPTIWSCLEQGTAPPIPVQTAAWFWYPNLSQGLTEYVGWLEKCILRCFDLQSQKRGGFVMPLFTMLMTLWKIDRSRFAAMMETLRSEDRESDRDPYRILDRVEKAVLMAESRPTWKRG